MGKLFISYRRADADFAHRLAEKLADRIDGTVFIDRHIAKDDFVEALETEIFSCNVFLLVITDNTFKSTRIHQDDDWIRREIKLALDLKKPIALAMRQYKTPPSPEQLPDDIASIVTKQGVPIYIAFFDEGVDAIAQHCVTISEGTLNLKAIIVPPPGEVNFMPDQMTIGDNSVQQSIHSAVNSTIIGQQTISDNRRRDALAKIESLRHDREEVIKYLNQLQYRSDSSTTSEGYVFQLGIVLFCVVIGFLIDPLAGVIVIALVGAYFVMRSNKGNQIKTSQKRQIQEVEQKIKQIDLEIQKQYQIENQLS